MPQKAVRLIACIAILCLFLQPSPIQANSTQTTLEAAPQRLESELDGPSPAGLTSSEWQSIQSQIISNPFQRAYLKASNAETEDEFGTSAAISGDTLVIGAPSEDSNGIGGPSNNAFVFAGAAYVFVRSAAGWTQQAYLKASNAGIDDNFGYSVAIDGDTIVVGAYGEGSSTASDPSNNDAAMSGAAYVFTRSGTTWSEQAYMKASNIDFADSFGWAVGISGDTIVVGARWEDSITASEPDNDTMTNAGAAYVFVRSDTTWFPQAILKASNPDVNDNFGWSVAVSGETILVSAPWEDSDGQSPYNNNAEYAGSAYVFLRSGTSWSQQAYLKASNIGTDDFFGESVAISGETIVVGAYGESSNATGVNGDQSNNNAPRSGAAYVLVRTGTTWSHQAFLKASNTDSDDGFGNAVAISGDMIVVGAHWEDSSAAGGQSDNSADNAGAAYVFARSGINWAQQAFLKASNAEVEDYFGERVAISGKMVVVATPYEDSNAMDNPDDNSADSGGAAYVFEIINKLFLPMIIR